MTDNKVNLNSEEAEHPKSVILIVDDEQSILNLLNRLLSKGGYHLFTAHNAEEAWQIIQSEMIDLLITDQYMPGMHGIDLLIKVKKNYPDIIRLLLTGREEIALIKKAVNQAGIFHFISKPWENQELEIIVQRALEYKDALAIKEKLNIENAIIRELVSLREIGGLLFETVSEEKIFRQALEQMVTLTMSQSGIGLIRDENTPVKSYITIGESSVRIKNPEKMLQWLELFKYSLHIAKSKISHDLPFDSGLPLSQSTIVTPLLTYDKIIGAIYLFRPKGGHDFTNLNVSLIETLASQVAVSVMNCRLSKMARDNYYATLKSLTTAIEAKDPYTRGHSERVMNFSIIIADGLGLSDQEKADIRFAGLLHDIGKIGIRDTILNKPESLSEIEFAEIKKHPQVGGKIVNEIPALRTIVPIIEGHHERYDGKGYPFGLKGDAIPFGARILSVADVFEALTSDRPYRKAMSEYDSIEIIKKGKNTQFEDTIVEVFLSKFIGRKST